MKIIDKGIGVLKIIVFIIDIMLIGLSYFFAFKIRFGLHIPQPSIEAFKDTLPYICIVSVILLYIYGLYSVLNKGIYETILSITLVIGLLTIISMAIAFVIRGFAFPRTVFLITAVIQLCILSVWRIIVLKIRRKTFGKKDVAVIGYMPEIEEMTKKIVLSQGDLYNVKYLFDMSNDFSYAYELIKDVDFIFASSNISNEDKSKILTYCMSESKHLFIIPNLFEISMLNSKITQFDDIPTLYLESLGLSYEQRFIKRMFDIILSSIGIIIAFPIMCIVAALIKITSPGPITFAQERVTKNNKLFKVYKFRTMVNDAEKYTGPVLATDKDPRITKIGGILRATRLDELPQLFNIFLGHMSIVGPRPERQFFINQFRKEIPEYDYRLTVKAGLTGLAQVLGKYTTSPQDKLRYDLLYIRNYSIWLDIKLIFQTIKIMFIKQSSSGLQNNKCFSDVLKEQNYKTFNKKGFVELRKNISM